MHELSQAGGRLIDPGQEQLSQESLPGYRMKEGEFAMSSVNTSSQATAATLPSPKAGDRILAALQSVGRSLMLPIAVLPAAALLLRFGQPELLNLPWMANAGGAIFNNLPMIFAIGIAVGLTGGEGAAALAICTALGIRIGFGFSAGLIDYVINFRAANTTQPLLLLVVGLVYAVVYYFVFSFFIKRFDLATPGRGEASTDLSDDWILPESQRGPRHSKSSATTVPTETSA